MIVFKQISNLAKSMKTRVILGVSILLLMSGKSAAAVVDVYIDGIINFDREVIRNPDLPQSVVNWLFVSALIGIVGYGKRAKAK